MFHIFFFHFQVLNLSSLINGIKPGIIVIKAVISGCNMLIPLFIMIIAGINVIKMLLVDQQHDDPVDPRLWQTPETPYLCAVPAF